MSHVPDTGEILPKITENEVYQVGLNNWVGPFTKDMLAEQNKIVTFGPAPAGPASYIEGIVLLLGLKALGSTPDGRRIIRDIAIKYLDTIGRIIEEMSQSSTAHPITCAMNQYVACGMYQRLGLMTAHDATQTRAWLDHQTGDAMETERMGISLSAVSTIVGGTKITGGDVPSFQLGGAAKAASSKILGGGK